MLGAVTVMAEIIVKLLFCVSIKISRILLLIYTKDRCLHKLCEADSVIYCF